MKVKFWLSICVHVITFCTHNTRLVVELKRCVMYAVMVFVSKKVEMLVVVLGLKFR